MKTKVLFLLLVFVVLLGGCESERPSVLTETISAKTINLEVGITVGSHTYLPINVYGNPADHAEEILQIVDAFEKARSELEVTSWSIEKDQKAYFTRSYIYGIWLNHRPKNGQSN